MIVADACGCRWPRSSHYWSVENSPTGMEDKNKIRWFRRLASPPLRWNCLPSVGMELTRKGEMKKGKEIRETINRYIELAGIVILKGDTGVFSIEKNKYWKIKKKRKRKRKETYIFDGSMAQAGTGYPTRSPRSVPSEKENLRGQKEMRRKRIWITGWGEGKAR